MRSSQIQKFMLLVGMCGLFAVSSQFACGDDACTSLTTGYFTSMDEINANRIETLDQAVVRQGISLTSDQTNSLSRDGQLFGAVRLDRPIKHPNGAVEMPQGWLPEIPEGHPWARPLTPSDDAFYSWFQERIVDARLFDPSNETHMDWANAYIARAKSGQAFTAWSYATASCNK